MVFRFWHWKCIFKRVSSNNHLGSFGTVNLVFNVLFAKWHVYKADSSIWNAISYIKNYHETASTVDINQILPETVIWQMNRSTVRYDLIIRTDDRSDGSRAYRITDDGWSMDWNTNNISNRCYSWNVFNWKMYYL